MTEGDRKVEVTGALIKRDSRYLLVQEAKPEVYGQWCTPGGKIEEGEAPEEATVREVKEEAGYDIRITKSLGVIPSGVLLIHMFEAEIIGGEPGFREGELMDMRWLTAEEILSGKYPMRGGGIIPDLIRRAENKL
jgi:8-oxo-dGTP diphosphatase